MGRTVEATEALVRAVAALAGRCEEERQRVSAIVKPAPRDVARAYAQLTDAQRRLLTSVDARRPFNAVAAAPRVTTVMRLAAIGLIERGRRGFADARLTNLGREARRLVMERRH